MREFIVEATPEAYFGLLSVCAAGGLIALLGALYFSMRARRAEDLPTSRIRSAAQGYVELEGIVRLMPGPKIVAPLTHTPCVWWRYAIYERGGRDRDGTWTLVEEHASDDLFLLDDDSGACIVDAEGANVTPTRRWTWYGDFWKPRVGPKFGSGPWNAMTRPFKYVEELIHAGDPVYMLGWFRSQTTVAGTLDEAAEVGLLLAEWKRDKQKMALFDVNKDGQVDLKEWEAARRVALQQVRREQLQRATDPDLHVLCRPPDRRPYLIHSGTQEALIRRARGYALLAFLLGAALWLAAAWLLGVRGFA
ncbi:MAG: hypothetical protein HYV18_01495 [Gammaproteobacteria bacterium]|nr:hypothetical protein [Gammaproteobacteria bacterium]